MNFSGYDVTNTRKATKQVKKTGKRPKVKGMLQFMHIKLEGPFNLEFKYFVFPFSIWIWVHTHQDTQKVQFYPLLYSVVNLGLLSWGNKAE
jgi:hypothetical protein